MSDISSCSQNTQDRKDYLREHHKEYFQENKLMLQERRKLNYTKKKFPFIKTDEDYYIFKNNQSLYKAIFLNRDNLDIDFVNNILNFKEN